MYLVRSTTTLVRYYYYTCYNVGWNYLHIANCRDFWWFETMEFLSQTSNLKYEVQKGIVNQLLQIS